MTKTQKNLKQGSALAVAIIVVLVLVFAALMMMVVGYHSRVRTIHETRALAARAAADSAMAQGVYLLKKQYATKGYWYSTNGEFPPDQAGIAVAGDGTSYGFSFSTRSPSVTRGFSVTLTATGTCGGTSKTIHCLLVDAADLTVATVADTIKWGNNFSVVGKGASLRTNSNAIGAITIGGGSTKIYGDLIAWDGDPANNSNANKNIDTVIAVDPTNIVAPAAKMFTSEKIVFPAVDIPVALKSAPVMPAAIPSSPSTPLSYQSGSTSGFTVPANTQVTLYVNGNITGDITVGKGGTLVVYVDGNVGGSTINGLNIVSLNTNQTDQAQAITILGTNKCTEVGAKNNFTFSGLIYAPDATLTMKNTNGITGSLICNQIDAKNMNSGTLTYIPDLANNILSPARKLIAARWWED
jgi:hypothetical protein